MSRPALPAGRAAPLPGSCGAVPGRLHRLPCPPARPCVPLGVTAPWLSSLPRTEPCHPQCHLPPAVITARLLGCPCPPLSPTQLLPRAFSLSSACESSLLSHHPEVPVCPLPSASVVHLGIATEVSVQVAIPGLGCLIISGALPWLDAQREGAAALPEVLQLSAKACKRHC